MSTNSAVNPTVPLEMLVGKLAIATFTFQMEAKSDNKNYRATMFIGKPNVASLLALLRKPLRVIATKGRGLGVMVPPPNLQD